MKEKNFLIIAIALVFLTFSISILKQILNNMSKKKNIKIEISKIEEKIEETDIEIKKYERLIKNLDDQFEQEKIARNKLKMVKPNEVIYKLIDKKEEE